MPGITWWGTTIRENKPITEQLLVGRQTFIRPGDPLLITNVTARAGSGGPRVLRPMYGADNYSGGYIGRNGGFAGVALYAIKTDNNGQLTVPPSIANVTRTGVQVAYPNQSLEMSQFDTTSGFCRVFFARWTPGNLFVAQAKADETFNEADVGKLILLHYDHNQTITLDDPVSMTFRVTKSGTITYPHGRIHRVILPDPSKTGPGQQLIVIEPVSSADQMAAGNVATT